VSAALAPGAEIAPGYEAIAHLSRGRRLDVYDAWSEERGCRCVVKALRPDRAEEADARRWLVQEGRLLERFTHPHIVRAYETLRDPIAVVLETLPGETLDAIVDDGRARISAIELAHLGLHLASALRYMHAEGFLHLDLKPSNVIASGGLAKLIDLSLARPPGPAPAGIGTWNHLAPEQALGEELTPAADVWGLGTVLFEMATGEPAFDDPAYDGRATSEEWSAEHERYPQLEGRAPRLSSLRADLPPEVSVLVERCLDPDPAARPDLGTVLATLEAVAEIPVGERRWRRDEEVLIGLSSSSHS
jgi:eukaryotic-like serine/threonine-protein kinase